MTPEAASIQLTNSCAMLTLNHTHSVQVKNIILLCYNEEPYTCIVYINCDVCHVQTKTIKQNLMINKARLVCLLINKAKIQFSGHEHWMSCSVWEVLRPAASSSRDEECRRCLHLAVPDPEEAQTHETTATVTHSSQYSTITAQYLINVSLSLLKHTRGQWMREVTFLRRLAQDCVCPSALVKTDSAFCSSFIPSFCVLNQLWGHLHRW